MRTATVMAMWMVLAMGASAWGQAETSKAAPKNQTPKTYTVASGPYEVSIELDGQFAAGRTQPIVYKAEVLKQFKIKQLVDHGAKVKKGQVLIEPDIKDLDKDIEQRKLAQVQGELALKKAEIAWKNTQATTPRSIVDAKVALERKKADLKRYMEKDRPMDIAQAREAMQTAEDRLTYAREELRQLEQMYMADDLTEETEEIVLKRTKDDLRRAELMYKAATLKGEEALNITIPRKDRDILRAAEDAEIAFANTRATTEIAKDEQEIALEKMVRDRKEQAEDFRHLPGDKKNQRLVSPMDGVVYYGPFKDGVWAGAAAGKLEVGGSVAADAEVMTVFDPGSLYVKTEVPEKYLHLLRRGASVVVSPAGFPETWLRGQVSEFDLTPNVAGKFTVSLRLQDKAGQLMPGMKCGVTLTAFEADKAITVPAGMLARGDKPGQWTVSVKTNQGVDRREVKVRLIDGGTAVIASGLKDGDELVQPE